MQEKLILLSISPITCTCACTCTYDTSGPRMKACSARKRSTNRVRDEADLWQEARGSVGGPVEPAPVGRGDLDEPGPGCLGDRSPAGRMVQHGKWL